jgi:putative two-component system response regulator
MNRREAQEIAKIGSFDLDIRTQRIAWSDTMRKILEVRPDEESSVERYMKMVHPDDLNAVRETTAALFRGVVPRENQYRILLDDGRIKWINTRYRLLRDEHGEPVSIHGTIQDITAEKDAERRLKEYSEGLELLVSQKVSEISAAQLATIYALVSLAESRDDDTGAHIERTGQYCGLLAEKLRAHPLHRGEVDDDFAENIVKASPLHDIGKVGIPDSILLKPARLTPEEFEIMKTHVEIGYQTLMSVEKHYPNNAFIRMGTDIARYHHEKWNGSGYLHGLSGEAIPLSARIMAVADVYDALRSKRVYKPAYPHERCVEIIAEGSGSHFDPTLVSLFMKNHVRFGEIFDRSVRDELAPDGA